jgi:hypothetical protein
MQKLFQKRYYYAFIVALCLFLIAITCLHSYYNLQSIIQPASNKWGRITSLGAVDLFKKEPSIIASDKYADVLTANKINFTHTRIDRATRETTVEIIDLEDVESYRVRKFDWDDKNIYFIESDTLYFVSKTSSGSYSAKTKISDKVIDFDIVNSEDAAVLAAAQEDGIVLYRMTNNGFQQYGSKYKIDKLLNLGAVQDKKGIIHIAAYAKSSAVDFPVYYIALEKEQWSLLGNTTEKLISESWTISDIDIGIDDTDTYIFYEMVKWDKFGMAAKVHNAIIPLNSPQQEIKFNRFYITEEDAQNPNSLLSEIRVIKGQYNNLKFSAVKDTYSKKNSDGFSGYFITMDDKKIIDLSRVTQNHRLISNTANISYKEDNIFVYLDAAGGFNYEAFYTETGKAYYENAIKPTKNDISVAVMETIPGYVSTVLVSFIKFTIYFPVILWFLIIEFFEVKKLKSKPKLTYAIGFMLYIIIKLVTFGSYYTDVSIPQMPSILTFAGAKYFYAVLFAVIAMLIQKLLKKHNSEMHIIAEFIVFTLIDIEFTNLLYAAYMV